MSRGQSCSRPAACFEDFLTVLMMVMMFRQRLRFPMQGGQCGHISAVRSAIDANLVAMADAPPTIDAMLTVAYDKAAIYFPFDDVIAADPSKDLGPGLRLAFVIGQSRVVGGTLTDMIAIADDKAQAEIWIGAEDHLPRMIRVTYFNEPGNFRHVVEFSNWHLDPVIAPGSFASDRAAKATRIKFASPDEKLPQPQ